MTLKEIKEKCIPVWKQFEDFLPMASKEEGERVKRKGLKLEQGSAKKMKISEDRDYWKIIRLGGHTAVYQFFVDMLKQFDREDLNQPWALVKETLSIRQASSDKEKELWVELKRMFEPDFEDQIKNTDSLNTKITKLNEALSDSKTNLYHYKLGLSQVEARLVEFETQEIKFCEKIRGLEFDVESKNNKIEYLMNELEQIKKEKEGLDSKLIGFKYASKYLDTLLGSQRTDKNKEGLRYSVVPPPTQVYSSLKKDISWTGLPEFADDTITDYSRPAPSIESNTSDLQNSNSSVSEHEESSDSIMSKPMIKFVKAGDSPTVIKTNKVETARKPFVKYAEMYRKTSKSPKVRGNQRNWNNLKS
nr:hypothetical protein [Tanacetum cinerariifolium]